MDKRQRQYEVVKALVADYCRILERTFLKFCEEEAFKKMGDKVKRLEKIYKSLPKTMSDSTLNRIVRKLSTDESTWQFTRIPHTIQYREETILNMIDKMKEVYYAGV